MRLTSILSRFFSDGKESRNLIQILNQNLKSEESLRTRYIRQAQGIRSPQVATKLLELAQREAEHTAPLEEWIRKLGQEPDRQIEPAQPPAWTLGEILVQDYEEERRLYEAYLRQAKLIKNEELRALFQKMAEEAKKHLQELTDLYARYS